jgi:aryl-alcohol dehydrogenase-like predicted oxidoreductase
MARRGVTSEMTVLVKGGHPPFCTPHELAGQLSESLDRLGLNQATLYMLHRDDTDISVGEFVDVLNSFVDDGLIQGYGFSNWTLDRVGDAIEYARSKNCREPVAVSNQMSLAVMEQPIYPGCLHVSDIASRQWMEQSKLALIPWSSQGRGVFTKPAGENDLATGELATSWFSTDNWRRVERARQLAAEKDVLPVNIALAWVLHQPFPTFPIIGPRSVDELTTSLRALEVGLTHQDVAWLNLESEKES